MQVPNALPAAEPAALPVAAPQTGQDARSEPQQLPHSDRTAGLLQPSAGALPSLQPGAQPQPQLHANSHATLPHSTSLDKPATQLLAKAEPKSGSLAPRLSIDRLEAQTPARQQADVRSAAQRRPVSKIEMKAEDDQLVFSRPAPVRTPHAAGNALAAKVLDPIAHTHRSCHHAALMCLTAC